MESEQSFFEKWGEGIKKITELQKLRSIILSTWIMIIGLLCGITIMFFNIKNYWWLEIILFAALFNTAVGQLSQYQKKMFLENIEKQLREVNNNE